MVLGRTARPPRRTPAPTASRSASRLPYGTAQTRESVARHVRSASRSGRHRRTDRDAGGIAACCSPRSRRLLLFLFVAVFPVLIADRRGIRRRSACGSGCSIRPRARRASRALEPSGSPTISTPSAACSPGCSPPPRRLSSHRRRASAATRRPDRVDGMLGLQPADRLDHRRSRRSWPCRSSRERCSSSRSRPPTRSSSPGTTPSAPPRSAQLRLALALRGVDRPRAVCGSAVAGRGRAAQRLRAPAAHLGHHRAPVRLPEHRAPPAVRPLPDWLRRPVAPEGSPA